MDPGDVVAAVSANPQNLEDDFSDAASIDGSESSLVSDMSLDGLSDAQKHWDENIRSLEHALFLVLCPVIGRVIGRRVAQNLWIRYCNWRWDTVGRFLQVSS